MTETVSFASALSALPKGESLALPAPNTALAAPLMTVLKNRRSAREYGDAPISLQTLSDLLWAAYGVTGPDTRRTAPSTLNKQAVDVYVVSVDGAWLYNASAHALVRAADGDLMPLIAGTPERSQDFVLSAAFALLFTADAAKIGPGDRARQLVSIDAAMAAQNALLYCEAAGLGAVPRATMNADALKDVLGLSEGEFAALNIAVGAGR